MIYTMNPARGDEVRRAIALVTSALLGAETARRAAAVVCAAVTLSAISACASNRPDPLPPVKSSTSTPTPDPSRVAYKDALSRWTEYEKTSEPIWAAGKHTTEATQLFKSYWERWRIPDQELRQFEAADVQVKGTRKILSSQAKSSTPGRVVIQQCVDYAMTRTLQHGKVVPLDQKRPQRRFITLTRKASTAQWLIYALDDATSKARSCAA